MRYAFKILTLEEMNKIRDNARQVVQESTNIFKGKQMNRKRILFMSKQINVSIRKHPGKL